MKILIVEDQAEKSKDIERFSRECFSNISTITVKQSLRSGLKEVILKKDYKLIFLDMSMPNFDPSPDDPLGGTPENFAGQEFLAQMKLRKIQTPVIIITQYQTFEEGQIDLNSIDNYLTNEYQDFYLGSVYYSSADKEWEGKLLDIIENKF